ncbi:bombesin receptor-activated protein C6orf89 homolog isoform X1 [Cyclopterus lumpus]|uniref:bombesin receptor-activated protein C6orf89 homolog isoform X1 n=1 Tax=Cyclopterus lumpus TaxID=8103 RepID=UPI00148743AD|nr:bombesin receptor-activated protein C6orf89 homolog isoform X1 [Cyclopterus lumpus]XP_034388376.1 bombesin receptor-activated protein C6orf89 homolog isoform X1 [Cyclopterus lumpus]
MGTTTSEPCIYDKLSESIDILRQSGYRYGMSEREIERFIKQVLETNEPRREPPQFPILRATIKFVVAVGFLLVVVLAFTYPHSGPQLGLVNLGYYNWSSPLSHVRLLSLPIAKKYNLQGFHEWWSAGSLRQNLVNCSGCAEISSVLEVPESLRGSVTLRRGPQLVLLKGGESLSVQRQQLEALYSAHSGSMSILLEEDDGLPNHNLGLPQGPANFTLLWRFSSGTREKVLRWLFPKAELCPLLDSAGTIVQRCLVTHSTNSQSKVSSHVQTSHTETRPEQRVNVTGVIQKPKTSQNQGRRGVRLAGGRRGASHGSSPAGSTLPETLQLLQPVADPRRHGLRRHSVLADGAVPGPRPEHHLRRVGLLSFRWSRSERRTKRSSERADRL